MHSWNQLYPPSGERNATGEETERPKAAVARGRRVFMDGSELFRSVLMGGATWSHVLKRGTSLRMVDVEGGANVAAYMLNFENPSERLNVPDTLKAQHTARLKAGNVLFSDMGRVLCSIIEDSVGWHDPLAGLTNAALIEAKYGKTSYQDHRNAWHQNARDGMVTELAKYGLGERDLQATVNFFSKVVVEETGVMRFQPDHSKPGSFVELRAEMNVLVVLNNSPHPLAESPHYAPKQVELTVSRVPMPGPDDPCRILCPENARGFVMTEMYFL
jgi:urea carboxylase-associated protein 2